MAQLVEHWLPKPRVAGSSPVYRSKIIGCTNQCTLFFSPTTNIWKITTKNNSWKFAQICGWLKTTNLTNLTNNYLALENRENRALGVLGALCESENPYNHAHHQPLWDSHPQRNQWDPRDPCEPPHQLSQPLWDFPPTKKSVRSVGSVWALASTKACAHKKRHAPRWVRCTPCDWNQSNPISESLIIHLFQV